MIQMASGTRPDLWLHDVSQRCRDTLDAAAGTTEGNPSDGDVGIAGCGLSMQRSAADLRQRCMG